MATATVNAPESQGERLSLNSTPWLEEHWERSGLPGSIWRRLRGIDAAASAAETIAEILAIDRQNCGLADGSGEQYVPLSPRYTVALGDALVVLMSDVRQGLDELHDFSGRYNTVIQEQSR